MSMFTPMTWNSRPKTWLYITAVFELLLAAIFLVVALAVPQARGGMLVTAIILGVVGLGLLAWARKMSAGLIEAERLKAAGTQGQARVVGFTQTGMSLNDNPMIDMDLEITIPGQQPYRVHHKEWVPLAMLGVLAMGATLPVRVDPADPSKLLIEWEQGASLGVPGMITMPGASPQPPQAGGPTQGLGALGALGAAALGGLAAAQVGGGQVASHTSTSVNLSEHQAEAERLAVSGITGTATITAVTDTGVALQGQRLYVVDAVVTVPGKSPAVAKSPALVPEAHAASLVQGATLPVRADATDPAKFAFSW